MAIGYACIVVGEENTKISHCTLKNANEHELRKIIGRNLAALEAMLDYNIKNNIGLFRISSDIIPFGSHKVNTLAWQDEFKEKLLAIGNKIKSFQIRVSMHPGQYTVLNSPNELTAKNAIRDLEYHCSFLDALGLGNDSKIIVHIGGVFKDKPEAINHFIRNFRLLKASVQKRIVIENDDISYHIEDILEISKILTIPAVFDNYHHFLNPPTEKRSEYEWIRLCNKTWGQEDGKQKIHYSQANQNARKGSHSNTIRAEEFLNFYHHLEDKELDIMLEVKDKNISAVKCINLTNQNFKINELEKEWAKYKYFVLSRSASIYNEIRELLKDKSTSNALPFYEWIEKAFHAEENIGAQVNAVQHIWGYVNDKAAKAEITRYNKLLNDYKNGKMQITAVKNHLLKCAKKQNCEYLIQSYYFYI